MNFSQSDKMHVLSLIKQGKDVPKTEVYDFILLDLLNDGLITMGGDPSASAYLTYFGFRTLEDWDPVLQVLVNHQLVIQPYGEA